MATSLGKLEKHVWSDNVRTNTYRLVMIIDLVDPEILWLKLKKKKEIVASKIYGPFCKFAKQAELHQIRSDLHDRHRQSL